MRNILRKIDDLFNRFYMGLSVVLLMVVIVATTIQVFTRYVMNASMSGTDEIARFAFVWMSMMGASICVRTHGHAVVSILNDALKRKPEVQKGHDLIIQILIVAGALVLLIYGIQLVQMTGRQRSAGLGISMAYTYACIPVGAFGMVINGLTNIVDDVAEMRGGTQE